MIKIPKSIKCSICGARSPRYGFANRMAWIRHHYKRKHPKKYWAGIRHAAKERKRSHYTNVLLSRIRQVRRRG